MSGLGAPRVRIALARLIVTALAVALATSVAGPVSGHAGGTARAVAERDLVTSLNAWRARQGRPAVRPDACLDRMARKDARARARGRTTPRTPVRVVVARCRLADAAVSVAKGLPSAASVVRAWSRSPAQRAVMRGSAWDRVGVGVTRDRAGVAYFSVILAERRSPPSVVPETDPETDPGTVTEDDVVPGGDDEVDEVDDIDNPPVDPVALRREVLALTNQTRRTAGLAGLVDNACLGSFAQAQAQAQADSRTMYHQALVYVAAACGTPLVGENVAYSFREAAIVQEAWMNSPGHRANILAPDWTQVGVGVATDAGGMPYYAVVFGAYPDPPPWVTP